MKPRMFLTMGYETVMKDDEDEAEEACGSARRKNQANMMRRQTGGMKDGGINNTKWKLETGNSVNRHLA